MIQAIPRKRKTLESAPAFSESPSKRSRKNLLQKVGLHYSQHPVHHQDVWRLNRDFSKKKIPNSSESTYFRLYHLDAFHDVVIKVKNHSFFCHRFVLSQSDVLLSMIKETGGSSNEKETDTRHAEILGRDMISLNDKYSCHTIYQMLNFLYGRPIRDVSILSLRKLFECSLTFHVTSLSLYCATMIQKLKINDTESDKENKSLNELRTERERKDVNPKEEFLAQNEDTVIPGDLDRLILETLSEQSANIQGHHKEDLPAVSFKSHLFKWNRSIGLETSDLVLISRDKRQFNVHRSVVASKSEHFHSMFSTHMDEAAILLNEVSGKVLNILLCFIYQQDLYIPKEEMTRKHPEILLVDSISAASLYGMKDMIPKLLHDLCKYVSKDNAFELLRFCKQAEQADEGDDMAIHYERVIQLCKEQLLLKDSKELVHLIIENMLN